MKYVDLHTDALTKEGVLSVTKESLEAGGCLLQCFAAFTPRGGLNNTLKLCDKFDKMCLKNCFHRVRRAADLADGEICAMLTVEGGEAIEGEIENLHLLHEKGVRMMTLVWNYDNEIGTTHEAPPPPYPPPRGKGMTGEALRRGGAVGLTSFGHAAVEKMGELSMIVDVSHGSEALFSDVAEWSKRTKIPFVASHSNAKACRNHTRNLSDEQIRALADCGGVMGLNFYDEFLSPDKSAEGQRAALCRHALHIVKVGGEDVLCFGSDFDGIPQNAYMKTAADMPRLIGDLERIFPPRIVEKIAFWNAKRVIGEVLRD